MPLSITRWVPRGLAAILWSLVILLALGYLGVRIHAGLSFHTDLLALLPQEQRNYDVQNATDTVTARLGRRVVVMVGDTDRAAARAAAQKVTAAFQATGLFQSVGEVVDTDRFKKIGALYFPYRASLLAPADRAALLAGKGNEVANRALSQVFGLVGYADAGLLRNDPFLLMPSFLTQLPFPLSRLTPDDGLLTVTADGVYWVLISASLAGEPYALRVQDQLILTLDGAVAEARRQAPALQVRRLGAVFFAGAGAKTAFTESTLLTSLSVMGTIFLILAVFRRFGPLIHNVLALSVGMACGLAGSLFLFGEMHVAALLFGTSLIGVAVDYGLYYSATLFDPTLTTPEHRLNRILPGIALGLTTTIIGYATLMIAPFPGLRQIAAFSIIGLVSAFLTVVLLLPRLDRGKSFTRQAPLLFVVNALWIFWYEPVHRRTRRILAGLAVVLIITGLARVQPDDDVRRMQSLSPALVGDQAAIQRLIGGATASQFLLVTGPDDETALRQEERLAPVLSHLTETGVLAGFQMAADFVPSAQRQAENRALVHRVLDGPLRDQQFQQIGLPAPQTASEMADAPLTLAQALKGGRIPYLGELVLAPGRHIVTLQGLTDTAAMKNALAGMPGVRLVDPTADFSDLLAKYRERAVWLTAFSALLMLPALIWRHGWRGAFWTMLPPAIAVLATPAILALSGQSFNFFHAMALVLVLSIGVDYAVFCAEGGRVPKAVSVLAVLFASLTTQLSFGLLSLSQVFAVHSFGMTMFIGILLAFLLAPIAQRVRGAGAGGSLG